MSLRRKRPVDERVVVADPSGAPRQMHTEHQRGEDRVAADPDGRARHRRLVAIAHALQRPRFGVAHQPLTIHREFVGRQQIAASGERRAAKWDLVRHRVSAKNA